MHHLSIHEKITTMLFSIMFIYSCGLKQVNYSKQKKYQLQQAKNYFLFHFLLIIFFSQPSLYVNW